MNEQANPEGLEARDVVAHPEHGPGVIYIDGDGTLSVATTTPSGKLHATGLDGWTRVVAGKPPKRAAYRLAGPFLPTPTNDKD